MKKLVQKNAEIVRFSLASLVLVGLFFVGVHEKETNQFFDFIKSRINNAASVFFTDSITEMDLQSRFAAAKGGARPIKIVIVPGHDDDMPGAEYRDRREADMNAALAERLAAFLSSDREFAVLTTRISAGYNSLFWDYRQKEKENILNFVKEKKQDMNELLQTGALHEHDGVRHNRAPGEVATTLYGVNKWANELGADIVIHIHFNDAGERRRAEPYKYTGFAIYIPENQYSNARASRAVAKPIFDRLSRFSATSNLPKENTGLVESQDLIAVGSYNTLDPVGMLIEYGYIYEPQFDTADVREKTITELAWQTYLGIHDYFKSMKSEKLADVGSLGSLDEPIEKGTKNKRAVLDLQKALLLLDAYPPAGRDLRDCPLSGNFGPCTEMSLEIFQSRENIRDEKGKAGEKTLDTVRKRMPLTRLEVMK